MKHIKSVLFFLSLHLMSQSQNVGIGTNDPVARLHVIDSAVLFTGPINVPINTNFAPPASGAGTRMMWYPQKGAFRAGNVFSDYWDKNNIGNYSISGGFNTFASGAASTSFGDNSKVSGRASFAAGYFCQATGWGSVAFGLSSTAVNDGCFVVGKYNDLTTVNSIFEVGNGQNGVQRSNALTVLENGNMGIGINAPTNPLTFTTSIGKKISLFPGSIGDAGMGIFPNEFRQYADNPNADITFGYDDFTNGFKENMRIKGNGNVGIGIANPSNPLSFPAALGKKISFYPGVSGDAGIGIYGNEFRVYSDNSNADITFGYDTYASGFAEKIRFKANGMVGVGTATPVLSTGTSGIVSQNSSYIQLRVQSSASAAGLEFKPSTGNQYEVQADNFNSWFVYNRTVNAYRLFINGSGFVGIGTTTPSQMLQVAGNILASGTITPSDIRYKKNIQLIQSPMEKLKQLNGVTYEYRMDEFPQMGFTDKEQVGLIAQEVEKVFPQLVVTDDKGYKAVDYVKLVPVLIESTKAQQG